MKSFKLFDQIILGSNNNNNNEVIIPWRTLIKEDLNIEKNFNNNVFKSISISTWIYMSPLNDNHILNGKKNNSSDGINHINRILSQQQQQQSDGNKLELGIFLGNESFDKRLYNINQPNRTSLESIYYQNKDELKYYKWEFIIFKLNFNENGNKLISSEIYLNFKIYKQITLDKELDISTSPIVLGSKEMLHQIIYSNLTIHFNDRHDIFSLLSTSTFIPTYPPNLINRTLFNYHSLRDTIKPINSLLELINWNENKQLNNNNSNNNNNNKNNNNNDINNGINNNSSKLDNNNSNNNNNNKNYFKLNISNISLNNKRYQSKLDPKRIHCHDMQNGYQLDRYSQGLYYNSVTNSINDDNSNNNKIEDIFLNSYNFSYWNLIDIFIYFTHHRISLPPVSWINSAHKNGVQVLGTIIFEWEEGYKEACLIVDGIKECIFEQQREEEEEEEENRDDYYFIYKLIEICKYYKFDGWFINLETSLLKDIKYVGKFQKFLKDLTREMHKEIPNSLVLWYDSVTQDGELKWQNQLNKENFQYFNNCDGIFLNYTWTQEMLKSSKEFLENNQCINRSFDVYVGTDVWGRGTFGGGNYNTSIGLNEANNNQLSSAIFAPGWTFESTSSSLKSINEKERTLWVGNNGIRNLLEPNSSASNQFKGWSTLTNENSYYKWSVSNGNGLSNGNCFKFERTRSMNSDSITQFEKVLDLYLNYSKELLEQIPIIEFEFYYKFNNSNNNNIQSNQIKLLLLNQNQVVIKEYLINLTSKDENEEKDIPSTTSSSTSTSFKRYNLNILEYDKSIQYIQVIIGSNQFIENNSNHEILITGLHLQVLLNNNLINESSIKSVTNERIPIISLPFLNNFNKGKGKKYWEKGLVLNDSYWFNLSDQDISDSSEDYRNQFGSNLIYNSISFNLSFHGGSCLNIKGKLNNSNSSNNSNNILVINKNTQSLISNLKLNSNFTISTLFKIDVPLAIKNQLNSSSLLVSFTWSIGSINEIINNNNKVCLILVLCDENQDKEINIILHPSSIKEQEQKFPFNINNSYEDQVIYESDQDIVISGMDINSNSIEWYQSKYLINIEDYSFNFKNLKLKEIKSLGYNSSSKDGSEIYNIYLGEVTLELINNDNDNHNSNNKNNIKDNIKISKLEIDHIWNIDNLTNNSSNLEIYDLILNWNLENNNNNQIKYTNIYLDNQWIGKTYSNGFYIIKNLKSLNQNSIITLELINNLNNSIFIKDFNIYQQ